MLDSDHAFALESDVIARLSATRQQWVPMAGSLHAFYTGEGWSAIDTETPSFRAWLGKPEIGVGYRVAMDMINAWQVFIVEHRLTADQLAATDPSKIAVVIPAVRAGRTTPAEAIDDCTILSRSDLREHYANAPASARLEACECSKCGNRHRSQPVAA